MNSDRAPDFQQLQGIWERLAQDDPLWAILSDPRKKGGKWDVTEFFGTGVAEIDDLLHKLAAHCIHFGTRSALDFGCGVGRLTQALAPHFQSVVGVDISATMIRMASELNRFPGNCRYILNPEPNLAQFRDGEFSFIYSNIVLQHIPPDISYRYFDELWRCLASDGLLIFQLASHLRPEQGMPAAAYNAELQIVSHPAEWVSDKHSAVTVRVKNVSPHAWIWDEQAPINLGNHWCDPTGQLLRLDDGRCILPGFLGPGEEVELTLDISTPAKGNYLLEVDLVHEGITWFKNRGSRTTTLPVAVTAVSPTIEPNDKTAVAQRVPASETPREELPFQGFSMHHIPRSDIITFFHQLGGRLEFIEPSFHAGPGFAGYMYYFRRP